MTVVKLKLTTTMRQDELNSLLLIKQNMVLNLNPKDMIRHF